MSGRFCPGDIVRVRSGLSAYEYFTGEPNGGNTIGSLLYGDRTGIIVRIVSNGYDVDFGKYQTSCISVPESLLVRA